MYTAQADVVPYPGLKAYVLAVALLLPHLQLSLLSLGLSYLPMSISYVVSRTWNLGPPTGGGRPRTCGYSFQGHTCC